MTSALLLSGYHAGSHARWAAGLQATFPDIEWTTLDLPPRHFKWRLRGNAWWWALEEPLINRDYDVIIATSMVDLASLIGLKPHLGSARKVVYFHENQFEYPTRGDAFDMNLGLANVYAALAADHVVFNSAYNRDSLLDGVRWMVSRLPDYVPKQTADVIADRSRVIPVGLEDHWFEPRELAPTGRLQLVWNHRWEYDKAPERLFAALELLEVDFDVHIVGQQFRDVPKAFEHGRAALAERIATWGYVTSAAEYRALLRRCDVVVSTAIHEFQGLAVLEAVASGCVAAVPDRLAYREFLPDHYRYDSHIEEPVREARKLAAHLTALAGRLAELRTTRAEPPEDLRWGVLAADWRPIL